jgi:hypothetical protein
VGEGLPFHWLTPIGTDADPTYAQLFNIDHMASDVYVSGGCWAAGVTEGRPPVTAMVYFDHKPIVCELR